MEWGTLLAIIGTLGGWELVRYLLDRKSNRRIIKAEADGKEFGVLRETVEFLQGQMHQMVLADAEKEKRFTEQTKRLRSVQDEHNELMKRNAATELELQRYRCVRPKCAQREPQNGY